MSLRRLTEKFLPIVGACLFLVVIIPLGIGSTKAMPDNAVLFVNPETGEYISPPCFIKEKHRALFVPARRKDVQGDKYHPEPECRNASGFVGKWQNVWMAWLFPDPGRWDGDGNWRY